MTGLETTVDIHTVLQRMNEPLKHLLRSVRQPITTVVSDLFVLLPMQEAHRRKIRNYFFLPTNLMAFVHYLNSSGEKLSQNEPGLDFDHQLREALGTADGLICNSIDALDKTVLPELRQRDLPIFFVAPLMDEHVRQEEDLRTDRPV